MKTLNAEMNTQRRIITRLLAAAGTLAMTASAVLAQQGNIGYVDWRRNYSNGWTEQMILTGIISSHWHLVDNAIIAPGGGGGVGGDLSGAGIAFFASGVNGVPSDLVRVTTVYGIDMTPNAPLPSVTGVDISNPAFHFTSVETIVGRSGATFQSGPVNTVMLSDLGSALPGMNLSWFAGGAPSSHVYVFETIAPLNEFYIPAPSSAALLGVGALALTRRRR